jgi:hypothetical protein
MEQKDQKKQQKSLHQLATGNSFFSVDKDGV